MRIRVFLAMSMLIAQAAVAAENAPLQQRLYRLVRRPVILDIRDHKFSLLPIAAAMDSTLAVRHIRETFGTNESEALQKVLQTREDVSPAQAKSAFTLEAPAPMSAKQKEALQADLTELLAILLQQEKAHHFHQSAMPQGRTITAPRVVIDDTDDPTSVRASCDQRTIHVSTGFLRRLLESAIASVNSGLFAHVRPERYDEGFGDWPPVVPALYTFERDSYREVAITIGPTMQRLLDQLNAFQRDVYPAAQAALARTGFKGDLADYGRQFASDHASTYGPVLAAAAKLPLQGAPAKRRDEIMKNLAAIEASFDDDPQGEEEGKVLEMEMQLFEPAAEEIMSLMTYTLWVEQEYLKALTFVLGHEAAHLWINGCRETVEDENLSDAFGVLVAFELFRNHHRHVQIDDSKVRLIMGDKFAQPQQERPARDEDAPLQWLLAAEGRSGVQLMVSVYRDIMSVKPEKHASFVERQTAVERIYEELVKSTVVITRN